MRWVLTAAIAACATVAAAQGAGPSSNDTPKQEPGAERLVLVHKPDAADDARVFPQGAPASGYVNYRCSVTVDGGVTDCTVVKEDPPGTGLAAAAMPVITTYRFKPQGRDGKPVAGQKVLLGRSYLKGGEKAQTITNPDWLKRPTSESLALAWPKKAMEQGANGSATISCEVTVEGYLDRCTVVSESPPGYGFGASALQLASQFMMKPKTVDGKPTAGGKVMIPINFQGMEGLSPETGTSIRKPQATTMLLFDPIWATAPTSQAVKAAYPASASDVMSGQVMLRCRLNREGGLRNCEIGSELPARKGFGGAAKSLAGQFRVQVSPEEASLASKAMIDVPFRFRNPAAEDTGRLTEPRWIRTLSANGVELLFPESARADKILTGVGQVNCAADTHGDLVDCQVAGENPSGKGFGSAALQAAQAMRMNIWTKNGDPVDGRRIVLPIRFTLQEAAGEAPKP